ncbi:cobalt-precorrin-5B (C(1))-methyltransferase CbiD [Clostridium sp. MD294]|uniref:cobalt-precorrin-5B (C(1))-methyltransferase CbiD n=1 Tax=Clostridium sp. MD294 TaxID=97138 RepID=UPI0002CCC6BC|nr:cobalt-precorrin-5B (C(1))-methyltransferase CbiD [Clostridium sp. MD294]NDO45567.1 cobalamin biosynthesis protein CbiD [Clostridium sp. MD294]USF30779.1 Cobalt-precorrin-5B C(1)-methyltransferase [Clostridium sp. MD294]
MIEKNLKIGYTTGSCAAAAAKGAVTLLLLNQKLSQVSLQTPKGIILQLQLQCCYWKEQKTICAVKKYSGDDPDVTNGMLLYAMAEKIEEYGIVIDGGKGIGRVTKRGLQREIGEAAINNVPIHMIKQCVQEVCTLADYNKGIAITIFAPEGVEIAKKTYNEKLGIVGGISILGTSGIVEPMSEQALLNSIKVELNMKAINSNGTIILTFGNYGSDFLKKHFDIDIDNAVKISNFIGECIDFVNTLPIQSLLLVGHIGKMIKIAGGVMQTHSKYADCRREIIGVHAAMAGAESEIIKNIMETVTTEQALFLLREYNEVIFQKTMHTILQKIIEHIQYRLQKEIEINIILFSEKMGILAQSQGVEAFLKKYL